MKANVWSTFTLLRYAAEGEYHDGGPKTRKSSHVTAKHCAFDSAHHPVRLELRDHQHLRDGCPCDGATNPAVRSEWRESGSPRRDQIEGFIGRNGRHGAVGAGERRNHRGSAEAHRLST